MTSEGHFLFAIVFIVFAKNAELTTTLAKGDWWHIIPSAIMTCLLPDIDHPKSFIGHRIKWISKPISRIFGHRGFTHSFLMVFVIAISLFRFNEIKENTIPIDAIQSMIFGYISHIFADVLTPSGVPLLWPCRWRFRLPILIKQKSNDLERLLCITLFICTVCTSQTLPKNSVICWFSKMISLLQIYFDKTTIY